MEFDICDLTLHGVYRFTLGFTEGSEGDCPLITRMDAKAFGAEGFSTEGRKGSEGPEGLNTEDAEAEFFSTERREGNEEELVKMDKWT